MSTEPFVIYEVNLEISTNIYEEFVTWLKLHIVEVLKNPGFLKAQVFCLNSDNPNSLLTVHYYVRNAKDLDLYLNEKALQMRSEGITKFGSAFTATRRILHAIT